jgi:Putative adhesin
VRVLWKAFAAVLVVAGLVWGTYNVVVLLAHEERVETESFPAAAVREIDVRNSAGSVRVVAGDVETVDVRVEISDGLRSTGERREIVGDVLELRGSCPNYGSDFCRVSYEISMPREMALTVHADDGSIDVDGLSGPLDLDSDNGSVDVRRVSGALRLSTDNGHVEGTDLRSPTVTADSDNGRVTLAFTAAPTTVLATTDNGSVEVVVPDDGESYALDLSTDHGTRTEDIRVDSASPRTITISTENGDAAARTAPS